MKLVLTLITVALLFVASMAESGALYLCYLCATSGSCPIPANPPEPVTEKSPCSSCCSSKQAACAEEPKAEPVTDRDKGGLTCVFVVTEDGELCHQCELPWEPPDLIATAADKSRIADSQSIDLKQLEHYSPASKISVLGPPLLQIENIHQTISSTILRC